MKHGLNLGFGLNNHKTWVLVYVILMCRGARVHGQALFTVELREFPRLWGISVYCAHITLLSRRHVLTGQGDDH